MNNIQKYIDEGFEGVDVSLSISLFEYGIIWRYDSQEDEYRFIFGIERNAGEYTKFDWATLKSLSDMDWADFKEVARTSGMTEEEWLELPFTQQVVDCLQYYGYENVFGTPYSGGFEIIGE